LICGGNTFTTLDVSNLPSISIINAVKMRPIRTIYATGAKEFGYGTWTEGGKTYPEIIR